MLRKPTDQMVIDTLREILINQASDREIAEKCLGDPDRTDTVSDIRRNPPGLRKDRKTGELHLSERRGPRTWQRSSMP
jgi:hypothetical protein